MYVDTACTDCGICGQKFKYNSGLRRHVKKKHCKDGFKLCARTRGPVPGTVDGQKCVRKRLGNKSKIEAPENLDSLLKRLTIQWRQSMAKLNSTGQRKLKALLPQAVLPYVMDIEISKGKDSLDQDSASIGDLLALCAEVARRFRAAKTMALSQASDYSSDSSSWDSSICEQDISESSESEEISDIGEDELLEMRQFAADVLQEDRNGDVVDVRCSKEASEREQLEEKGPESRSVDFAVYKRMIDSKRDRFLKAK